MNDNVITGRFDNDIFPLSVEDVLDGVIDDGAVEVFVIARNDNGHVNIYSNLGAEAADDLLDEGIEEYERLLSYDEEDDDDGNIPA